MRRGLLKFSSVFLERDIEETSEILSQIKFVPFRVEHLYHYHQFEMIGYSPFFENIIDWEETPEYNLSISRIETDDGFKIEVAVEKKDAKNCWEEMEDITKKATNKLGW